MRSPGIVNLADRGRLFAAPLGLRDYLGMPAAPTRLSRGLLASGAAACCNQSRFTTQGCKGALPRPASVSKCCNENIEAFGVDRASRRDTGFRIRSYSRGRIPERLDGERLD